MAEFVGSPSQTTPPKNHQVRTTNAHDNDLNRRQRLKVIKHREYTQRRNIRREICAWLNLFTASMMIILAYTSSCTQSSINSRFVYTHVDDSSLL